MKKFWLTKFSNLDQIMATLKTKLFIFVKPVSAKPHNPLSSNLNTLFVMWIQQTDYILEMHTLKLARWDQILKFGQKFDGQKSLSQKRREIERNERKLGITRFIICKSTILWKQIKKKIIFFLKKLFSWKR